MRCMRSMLKANIINCMKAEIQSGTYYEEIQWHHLTGYHENETKKQWMTDEIINMIKKNPQTIPRNDTKYITLYANIKNEKQAGENVWLSKKCAEIDKQTSEIRQD